MERQAVTKVQKTPARANHLQTPPGRSSATAHPILELQRSIGNSATQRLIRSPYIQRKLQVSTPGDPYEQEADRVADTVMRMPEPQATAGESTRIQAKPLATRITPLVQRAPEEPSEEDEEEIIATKPIIQRAVPLAVREDDEEEKVALNLETNPSPQEEEKERTVAAKLAMDAPLRRQALHAECASTIQSQMHEEDQEELQKNPLSSQSSQPPVAATSHSLSLGDHLPGNARAYFEPRFGQDFSQVRVHTGKQASDSAKAINAKAYTMGKHIVFRAGEYAPETGEGRKLLAHELTHVVQQGGNISIQRQQAGGTSTSSTSQVGIAGGESQTPSDQTKMASGYKEREDGKVDTFDARVVSKEQALAESKVISSEGIFMGAYLARYNELKETYKLPLDVLDKLSTKAGFMQQFKTGDIVLRQMNAADSQALAKITDSNYSHSGIIQVNGGRVWVLDSYPSQKKTGQTGDRKESTELTRLEDFFGDQHREQITQGIVLRIKGLTEPIRANINSLIDYYNVKPTTFDYEFKVDNDQFSLYCSELVWRILLEASSTVLPPNEFEFTRKTVVDLINQLEALVAILKSQGTDTSKTESQLALAKSKLKDFETASAKELYSPGSLERTGGLEPVTGFTREGKIEGEFEVVIVSGTVPNDFWDTPDAYVTFSGGLLGASGKTKTKDDTTTPTWNETLVKLDYDSLSNITLKLFDEDIVSDDLLATFTADLRPVNPKGQTFVLSNAGATITVMVKGVDEGKSKGAFGPQAPRKKPAP
jgi:hypothetical protein